MQADVHDHMDYILTSMEMFAGVSENLIDYTFNVCAVSFLHPSHAPSAYINLPFCTFYRWPLTR